MAVESAVYSTYAMPRKAGVGKGAAIAAEMPWASNNCVMCQAHRSSRRLSV